jgi:LPXTG-motif cell wall-anchored protein
VEGEQVSVEKSDLEAKLREIQEIVDETTDSARTALFVVAGAVLLLLVIFLLGRRKGKKGSARVEVFRLG